MSYSRNLARLARSGAPSVPNVQALEVMPIFSHLFPEAVLVKGYHTEGDGGACLWHWDSDSVISDPIHIPALELTPGLATGRWVPLLSGPFDLRAAGITSIVADAPDNWERLLALFKFLCLEHNGWEVYVPDVGAPFTVDGGVPPQYMDHMRVRGPGEIRNVNPGSSHNRIKGPIFYGGTYGASVPASVVYEEPGLDLDDADAGAQTVTLTNTGDGDEFSVGELVLIHDGTLFYRDDHAEVPILPRYLFPHTREVVGISGDTLTITPPLSYGVGNGAKIRKLNTGLVAINASPWPGIDSAYLARDFSIECNLSAAFDYNEITGEVLPLDSYGRVITGCFYDIGFRATYRGRFKSKNGFSGNLGSCCTVDADLVCGDARAYDAGYATEGSNIVIRLSHSQPETTSRTRNLIFLNEGSHSCKLHVSTPQPISSITEGTNVLVSAAAFGWDCHLDLDMPNRTVLLDGNGVPYRGGILSFGYEDADDTPLDPLAAMIPSRDIRITGRVKVAEAYSIVNFGSPGALAPDLSRNTLIHDFVFDCDTIVDPSETPVALRIQECNGVTLDRVWSQAAGQLAITSCSDVTILNSYLPNMSIQVNSPLPGFWSNVSNNVFSNRIRDVDLLRAGQLNIQTNGVVQSGGPFQVVGSLYTERAAVTLDSGASGELLTAAELGDSTIYQAYATSSKLAVSGLALVRVSASAVYVTVIHESGMAWGTAYGGTALTITNLSGSSRTINWNLIKL